MVHEEWSSLPEKDQGRLCQSLSPYEDWPLFKAVEGEFDRRYGVQPGVARVFCGLAGGLGPYNALVVTIRRGQPRTKLPKSFMGFPVMRSYQRKG